MYRRLALPSMTRIFGARFTSTFSGGYDELFNPTDDVAQIRKLVADFSRAEIAPTALERDLKSHCPKDMFKKFGDLGLLGITVPEQDGGSGLGPVAVCAVHEEMSRVDPGLCLAYLAHTLLFVHNFRNNASEALKKRVLPQVISGDLIGCMGMSEPGAGTDVLGMKTTATRQGASYVLNGEKVWITNGPECDVALVYAKTDGRVSAFLVERGTPGFTTSGAIDKLGMRGSSMGYLRFENATIPADNLLGEEGKGTVCMMQNLEIERLALAAMSCGIALECCDIMLRYANERVAFGQKLRDFGQIQRYIGESFAQTQAARCLVYNTARSLGTGSNTRALTDAAKLFAAPVGKLVADNAMQVLGGAGYSRMYEVERLWRDAKLLEIGGGTLEGHQKNITKDLSRGM